MSTERNVDEETYDDTLGTALDLDEREEGVLSPFLVPRMAAYALSGSSFSSVSSQGDAEEDHAVRLSGQSEVSKRSPRDSGEGSAAHSPADGTGEGVALGMSHGGPGHSSASADEEAPGGANAAVDPFLTYTDDDDVDRGCQGDEYDIDEEDEEGADSVDASPEARSSDHGGGASDASNFVNAFAHSRVKALLKYEGSSSIISKDATMAACEAVALLTRDLVTMATGEATRRHRKTVTYEDVARVVQLLDRFSFLTEVVPPVAASSRGTLTAGRPIVVGSNKHSATSMSIKSGARRRGEPAVRSRSVHGRAGRNASQHTHESLSGAARSKTAHARVLGAAAQQPVLHTQPGSGLRQATLRF
ncbi:hypothetical protein JKF63_01803 [Porcisia hertigi]|uniref:Transcription factor CBF/NF-Y/archaeal histone domain-containing protein n=1 Tax=Porcisia hertigi TaxID=2761500 RepID=A0A836L0F4_9TRYP|nr:hypothetical protein JKF63_01803 [Porcisia hertigi]